MIRSARMQVRRRVMARNIDVWKLTTIAMLQPLVYIAGGVMMIMSMMGIVSVYWFAAFVFLICASTLMYILLWRKMLMNMSQSHDKVFVRKMIRDGIW